MNIPFNKPYLTGEELNNISLAHQNGQLAGDGEFTKKCQSWLEETLGVKAALLTHSCTAALEMASMLIDISPGDEIILPSFTFVSSANAFVLRGGIPRFVDISPDTLNINPQLIEEAITEKTKAIMPVHYAGNACDMSEIMRIARKHDLYVIEDAAQAVGSTYGGTSLGSIGELGCLSFHETKNVIAGEGGALLINSPEMIERAEIIREKGTNRSKFFRGEVDKYTWVDMGSSFLPGELIAAFLYAQLKHSKTINSCRVATWTRYYNALKPLAEMGLIQLPTITQDCQINGHIFYLLLRTEQERYDFIDQMRANGISTVFHYVPLHNSPYIRKTECEIPCLPVTEDISSRLVRLPIWIGIDKHQDFIIENIFGYFGIS